MCMSLVSFLATVPASSPGFSVRLVLLRKGRSSSSGMVGCGPRPCTSNRDYAMIARAPRGQCYLDDSLFDHRHAPESGYRICRLKLIRVLRGIALPSGSENVRAMASAESGEGIPRLRMSCLDSSTSLPELSYL